MSSSTHYRFFSLMLALLVSPVLQAAALSGEQLYQQNCAVCHGAEGDGGVGIPLNLPDFLAVASDDYFRQTLRYGRPGRVMPAFPGLGNDQVDAIISHIRGWSDSPRSAYSEESLNGDAERGKQLFLQKCAACHGESGDGGKGTGVTFSRDRSAPVMAPSLHNAGFQHSVSDGMLKATLLRGRHGTPMPSISELGLDEEDANHLVVYLRTFASDEPPEDEPRDKPVIQYESSYDLEQTLENLKQAVIGRNFSIIREQYLDDGLAPEGEENHKQVILYFCNFSFLHKALGIDPRVGLFLPCRVTLVETQHGVQVMSINPKTLSRLFNNAELDKACQQMYDLYEEIIEEATL